MTKIEFSKIIRLAEFNRDIKKLQKRLPTLEDDLKGFINYQLKLIHKLGIENGGVVRISGLGIDEPKIYKARRFACKALKGSGSRSGIRIIYAYHEDVDTIKLIEIYYKGDKASEDIKRINKYY